MSSKVSIVGGPSKLDLMLALFDGKSSDFRTVTFHLNGGEDFDAQITSVEREDGSGESWNFEGTGRLCSGGINTRIEGYYRTDRREGYAKFPDGMQGVSSDLRRLDEVVRQSNIAAGHGGQPVRRY